MDEYKNEIEAQLAEIDEALVAQYENLNAVKAGSEEHERIGNIIYKLESAKCELTKAYAELENKKIQNKSSKIQNGVAIGGLLVGLASIGAQLWSNIRLAMYEEDNAMTSKTYNGKFQLFHNRH